MSKLMTTSTWGMSSPLLATSVAMRIGRDLLLNLFREPSRLAWGRGEGGGTMIEEKGHNEVMLHEGYRRSPDSFCRAEG